MKIIAHRGASDEAPENTRAAIALAWRQKADAVEVDVRLTADQEVVVLHDADLKRTGRLRKPASGLLFAALGKLDVGSWFHPRYAAEFVPGLLEVLSHLPRGKELFVEIKGRPAIVRPFIRLCRNLPERQNQLVVIGFSAPMMRQIKRELPAVRVCLVADWAGARRSGGADAHLTRLIERAVRFNLDGLDLDARGPLNRARIRQIHDAGLLAYVWTVDDPRQARALKAAGIDGVTTNRPGTIRKACRDVPGPRRPRSDR